MRRFGAIAGLLAGLWLTVAVAGGEAAREAFALLADELGTSDEGFELARYDDVVWSDSCLGAAEPGEACDDAEVDGHVVWVSVGTEAYRLHTDLDGLQVRLAAGPLEASAVADAPLPEGASERRLGPGSAAAGPGSAAAGNAGLAGSGTGASNAAGFVAMTALLAALLAVRHFVGSGRREAGRPAGSSRA